MQPFVFPDDEWEECQPGDSDCEEVEIDENGQVGSLAPSLCADDGSSSKSRSCPQNTLK
jgi:hypothetical protein